MSLLTVLANHKQQDVNDYTLDRVRGYTFVDTCGHGYLCLSSEDNGYSDALQIARKSNYSFVLDGGLVFLEEDCDAPAFLKTGVSN